MKYAVVIAVSFVMALLEAACIAYLWLWLIVPMGAPLLLFRQAFAVGMFINFFIMQHSIGLSELKPSLKILRMGMTTGAYLLLSYIYSVALL